MNSTRSLVLTLIVALMLPSTARSEMSLEDPLPVSPNVRIGKLDNGITYFIRKNGEPENRIEMRLVVNAGSIQEDDDQRGLAHFVEHMAFNGTEHFGALELVDYLETIGMRFGADVNAYTSFDETVYMLTVPADNAEYVDKAFLILEDWAHGQLLLPEEVEKERGVVIEEWRLRRGADQRMREQHWLTLFEGSRYGTRLPIGTKKSLDTFTRDEVERFYRDWYRPDLMAVVVVGEVDVDDVESRIKKQFGGITVPADERDRAEYDVPAHPGTVVSIATDEEADGSSVTVVTKLPIERIRTVGDLRKSLVRQLFTSMLNDRYSEIVQKGTPPFVVAFAGGYSQVRGMEGYSLSARTRDDDIAGGFRALVVEAQRVLQHGFTASELERSNKDLLSYLERSYKERDKTDSARHAGEYADHFLEGDPIPGIEFTYEAGKELLPTITLDEINALSEKLFNPDGRVVMVSASSKPNVDVPTAEELESILADVAAMKLDPYQDTGTAESLISSMPTPGTIVKEVHHDVVDVDEWVLSNGVHVLVKKTDFMNEEIIFGAWSPGGTSLADDATFPSARLAGPLIGNCGIGEFSVIDLQKLLAGKQLRVSPAIGELTEGFRGSSTPEDLETMMQIVYLFFTAPRHDEESFNAMKSRFVAYLQNMRNNPDAVYNDSLTVIFSHNHPRSQPVTAEALQAVDLDVAYKFFVDRYADAEDFTMAFVGAIDVAKLRTLVEQYVASLPATDREESWRDVGREPPAGVVVRSFERGVDEKSRTTIEFHGDFDWSRESRYALSSLDEALNIRLREVIREEKSGTYGVRVSAVPSRYPHAEYQVQISFGADPARLEELVDEVFGVIEQIKTDGVSDEIVTKILEIQKRELEERMRENNFWVGALQYCELNGIDFKYIVERDDIWATCSSDLIRDAARKYLDTNHFARVSMFPEKAAETGP